MRILVCDDDALFAETARREAQAFIPEAQVSAVTSGDQALAMLAAGEGADIYFLDIELPGTNGMELARRIRDSQPDALILFLTAHDEYVFQAFYVSALRYVRKDRLDAELPEALDAAVRLFRTQHAHLVFQGAKGEIRLPKSHVAYLQKVGRDVVLHQAGGGTVKIRGTITALAKELAPMGFVQPNSGCTVHPAHMAALLEATVVMEDGARLPVSRLRKKAVARAVAAYWKEAL